MKNSNQTLIDQGSYLSSFEIYSTGTYFRQLSDVFPVMVIASMELKAVLITIIRNFPKNVNLLRINVSLVCNPSIFFS
jgi:hypothetical protein